MISRRLIAGLLLAASSSTALASPIAEGSSITARAGSGALLSLADGYTAARNPAAAALSSAFGDIEFLSDDLNLFFDFQADGTLSIYGLVDGLSNSFEFDFDGLSGSLFAAATAQSVSGLSFEVLDSDTLRVTLNALRFASDGSPYTAQLQVPEPSPAALAALAAALLALSRRARRNGRVPT